jgi:hypothetical protein
MCDGKHFSVVQSAAPGKVPVPVLICACLLLLLCAGEDDDGGAEGIVGAGTLAGAAVSGNKMIDTFDRERYSLIAQQYFKLKAPNLGSWGTTTAGMAGSGEVTAAGSDMVLSRSTKIIKPYIPGRKFGKRGNITYENGSQQFKSFDYLVLLFAYANYSAADASASAYYVARLNDSVIQLYYKDA